MQSDDVAANLLGRIQATFLKLIGEDEAIYQLQAKVYAGQATYADAGKYAEHIGSALSKAFTIHLSSAALPGGAMYSSIAENVLRPLFEEEHQMISAAATQVQAVLSENAGIGIKPMSAQLNTDRIDGFISKISAADSFDNVAWVLGEPVITFSLNVVDETVKANVEFQGKAGLRPRVYRRAESKCCKWCRSLAGSYNYPDLPQEVYQRHENCRCTVEYDPGDGRRQNVHTRQWATDRETAKIEARKLIGAKTNGVVIKKISKRAQSQIQERSILQDSLIDTFQNPLEVGEIKTDSKGNSSFTVVGKKTTAVIDPQKGTLLAAYPTHSGKANRILDRKKAGK